MRKVYKISAELVSQQTIQTILWNMVDQLVAGEDFNDAMTTARLHLSTCARKNGAPNDMANTARFNVSRVELIGDLIENPPARRLVLVPEAS